ncbi:MAG TPA: hypothetical protein VGQ86_08120, partial [Candidatus Limnocylindria bacterium]|nr:hypothetical protein [Candidatus Limnocylindria bacterium]
MNAIQLLSAVTQVIYALIFALVLVRTVRQPTPAHIDMTLFFGATASLIVASRLSNLAGAPPPPWLVPI